MQDAHVSNSFEQSVVEFWDRFVCHEQQLRACGNESFEKLAPNDPATRAFIELQHAYRGLSPDGALRIERVERSDECRLILSTGNTFRQLERVAGIVSSAPAIDGWTIEAFEQRQPLPARVSYCGQEVAVDQLRFSYKLCNNQIGFIVLSDGVVISDYTGGRELARKLVATALGELDFCRHVSDAQLVDYSTWLALVPGGQSFPLCELTKVFDPVFRRQIVTPVDDTSDDGSQMAA
jgi:hypothetical protein